MGVEGAPLSLMLEQQAVAPPGPGAAAPERALGQPCPAQRHEPHGAAGHLPSLPEVNQGDGVHPHVAVVRNGEGQGALAVHHQIAVPLLQTERDAPHLGAVVHRQQPPGPPRLGQLPLLVQQRDGLCDLMLHQSCLLSAGVPPAFHRAILPSISGKRKGQRGPHIRAAPVGDCRKRHKCLFRQEAAWRAGLDFFRNSRPTRHEKCHFRGSCPRK